MEPLLALARVHEVHVKHTAFGCPDDGFTGASPVCWLFAVSGSQSKLKVELWSFVGGNAGADCPATAR